MGLQNEAPLSDAAQGSAARLSLQMASADIETLIVTVGQQLLREHHVSIAQAKLTMVAPAGRVLEADLMIRARRGIATARLRATTQLVIDGNFIARLSRLDITGRGVLGRLVARFVQPRIPQLLAQRWPLNTLTPAGICLQDIEITAHESRGILVECEVQLMPAGQTQDTGRQRAMLDDSKVAAVAETKAIANAGRLEIFVVDSGWNEEAKQVLDRHFALFEAFLRRHIIYRLNQEQSKLLLEENPTLIGQDPVLVIMDSDARIEKRRHGYGCRLCLGAMPPDKLSGYLKKFLQIICDQSKTKEKILRQIRKEGQKEGFDGTMELIGEIVRPE